MMVTSWTVTKILRLSYIAMWKLLFKHSNRTRIHTPLSNSIYRTKIYDLIICLKLNNWKLHKINFHTSLCAKSWREDEEERQQHTVEHLSKQQMLLREKLLFAFNNAPFTLYSFRNVKGFVWEIWSEFDLRVYPTQRCINSSFSSHKSFFLLLSYFHPQPASDGNVKFIYFRKCLVMKNWILTDRVTK